MWLYGSLGVGKGASHFSVAEGVDSMCCGAAHKQLAGIEPSKQQEIFNGSKELDTCHPSSQWRVTPNVNFRKVDNLF